MKLFNLLQHYLIMYCFKNKVSYQLYLLAIPIEILYKSKNIRLLLKDTNRKPDNNCNIKIINLDRQREVKLSLFVTKKEQKAWQLVLKIITNF